MKRKNIYKSIAFLLLVLIGVYGYAKQEKVVQIFRNGEVIQEYGVSEIDYIEVNDVVPVPEQVNATVSDNQITISWNEVEGAKYNVYRSADNVNFSLIASDLNETSYTDATPLNGSNYYRVKAVVDGKESDFTASAAAALTNRELESGIYLGISGFNQTTFNRPIELLTTESAYGCRQFVDGLTMKNGTLLYYSVDEALNAMQSVELPADISTAAIVTFTDGLDQGSMMKDVPYEDDVEYLDAINNRLRKETVAGQPITAYSIGLRGTDVADVSMFRSNLAKLSYNPNNPNSNGNAFEVSSMAEVNAKFKEIAEHLSNSTNIQTISLKIPGVSNGTLIRFTFDNVNYASNSKVYIEGRFNLKERSLEDVKYVGLSCSSGSVVKGSVEDIFVSFKFEDVVTENEVLITGKATDEWTYISSNGTWQINSEFDNAENTDIVTEKNSAVIMLVLDCSSSLAGDFVTAQKNAKDFINTLGSALNIPENPLDKKLYITGAGDFVNGEWNAESPDEFRVENGNYVYEVKNLEYIMISTSFGSWNQFNEGYLGCNYGKVVGVSVPLQSGYRSNIVCPWKGDYKIVVAGDLSTITLYTSTPRPANPPIYLRGDMNSWGAEEDWKLEDLGNGIYRFICSQSQSISIGEYFKIADDKWKDVNIGSEVTPLFQNSEISVENGGNSKNMTLDRYFNGVLWLKLGTSQNDNYIALSNDKDYIPSWASKGSIINPYSVSEFIAAGAPAKGEGISGTHVKGYIVGIVNGTVAEQDKFQREAPFSLYSNILIAESKDETDITRCVPVQLVSKTEARTNLNLGDNPQNLGHEVIIEGTRETYFSVPGLKAAASYQWIGDAPAKD